MHSIFSLIVLVAVAGVAVGGSAPPTPRLLGEVAVPFPAFCAVLAPRDQKNLYVSRFAGFPGADAVSVVPKIGTAAANLAAAVPALVAGSVTWPNEISAAPRRLFGGRSGIVAAGGFLVPGKNNGGLWFSESTSTNVSAPWVNLITTAGWFYHRVFFHDANLDGKLDIITCRAFVGAGPPRGMLVWLEPANRANPTGAWIEHEILPGCDALFLLTDLNNDRKPEVVAPLFFGGKIQIYYSTDVAGRFDSNTTVAVFTLDSTVGVPFDVEHVDLDGDMKKELLVTNHQANGAAVRSSVFAYEIPADFKNASAYVRHTLASGFPVTQPGATQAAPGTPKAFSPLCGRTGRKHIALAGDGAQRVYILVPAASPNVWNYTVTELQPCGASTVGTLAVDDVDNDGYTDIFVPCYNTAKVVGYTYAPLPRQS